MKIRQILITFLLLGFISTPSLAQKNSQTTDTTEKHMAVKKQEKDSKELHDEKLKRLKEKHIRDHKNAMKFIPCITKVMEDDIEGTTVKKEDDLTFMFCLKKLVPKALKIKDDDEIEKPSRKKTAP